MKVLLFTFLFSGLVLAEPAGGNAVEPITGFKFGEVDEYYRKHPKFFLEMQKPYLSKLKNEVTSYSELLNQILGGNPGVDGVKDFMGLVGEEKAAAQKVLDRIRKLNFIGTLDDESFFAEAWGIRDDLDKLAQAGEKSEAFVKNYFGGPKAARGSSLKDAKTVADLANAIKASNEYADFRDTVRDVFDKRLQIKALKQAMENTATSYYLQAQMESLLASNEFCAAAKACSAEPAPAKKAPKLDGLFDRKTHERTK